MPERRRAHSVGILRPHRGPLNVTAVKHIGPRPDVLRQARCACGVALCMGVGDGSNAPGVLEGRQPVRDLVYVCVYMYIYVHIYIYI